MPPIHKLNIVPNPLKTILAVKALLFDKSIKKRTPEWSEEFEAKYEADQR